MDIPYETPLKRGLVILILAIAGIFFVSFVSSEYGSNRIEAANFYTSTVLSLLLVWVYLNISDIQSQQVEFDGRQTRLMERQNRLQSLEYEPELRAKNRISEGGFIKFEDLHNRGNGVAFGLNLKISPASSPNSSDPDLEEYRIKPDMEKSDFRGYLRPDDKATVYFDIPERIDEKYISQSGRIQIELEYTDAAGDLASSRFFYEVRPDEDHASLTDFFN